MRINIAMLFGIVLIVAGAIGLAVKGIEYTSREQVLDVGPIQATAETQKEFAIPTWAAGAVVILVAGARGRPS
jgi:hypothetical protein